MIRRSYEINSFLKSGSPIANDLTSNSRRALKFFTTRYPRPEDLPPDPEDDDTSESSAASAASRRTRHGSSPAVPARFPPEWVVDKYKFSIDIQVWRVEIDRINIIPASFEPTPPPSNIATPTPNMAAAAFSEAQRTEMASIIAQAMHMFNQTRLGDPQQPAAAGLQGAQPAPRSGFRPRDVGYFDPNPDILPVEAKDSHNIYHNVFSFTNRLRVKASTMDIATLRQNVDACLLGTADDWYTNQLDDLARSGLRNDPDGVNQWCRSLEARFRDSPGKSLALLESVRYTVRDAKNRRDPADYVNTIVLNSKNAGFASTEYAQVRLAYEHMDRELRQNLPRPSEQSTISNLLTELRY